MWVARERERERERQRDRETERERREREGRWVSLERSCVAFLTDQRYKTPCREDHESFVVDDDFLEIVDTMHEGPLREEYSADGHKGKYGCDWMTGDVMR